MIHILWEINLLLSYIEQIGKSFESELIPSKYFFGEKLDPTQGYGTFKNESDRL